MYNPLMLQTTTLVSNVQVGTIGLVIELGIREGYNPLNISSASAKSIILKNPNNISASKVASFLTDGEDGIILFATTAGDLDVAGTYYVQGYIEMGGFKGYTSIASFDVIANL